jgi:hypothetical protein
MNQELNDVQFDILDAIYFVEPLANILEEVDAPRAVVLDELRTMIDRGWVQVLRFDEARGDYVRTAIYDSDQMGDFRYLATKDGLMKHHGQG